MAKGHKGMGNPTSYGKHVVSNSKRPAATVGGSDTSTFKGATGKNGKSPSSYGGIKSGRSKVTLG